MSMDLVLWTISMYWGVKAPAQIAPGMCDTEINAKSIVDECKGNVKSNGRIDSADHKLTT
jgi:hypothetical protein